MSTLRTLPCEQCFTDEIRMVLQFKAPDGGILLCGVLSDVDFLHYKVKTTTTVWRNALNIVTGTTVRTETFAPPLVVLVPPDSCFYSDATTGSEGTGATHSDTPVIAYTDVITPENFCDASDGIFGAASLVDGGFEPAQLGGDRVFHGADPVPPDDSPIVEAHNYIDEFAVERYGYVCKAQMHGTRFPATVTYDICTYSITTTFVRTLLSRDPQSYTFGTDDWETPEFDLFAAAQNVKTIENFRYTASWLT